MALFFVEICSDMDSVVLTKYGFIIQIHMNWSFTIEAFDILPLNKKYNNFGLITTCIADQLYWIGLWCLTERIILISRAEQITVKPSENDCVSLCLPSATAAAAAAMTVAWCRDTGENTGTGNSVYLMFITNNHASQTFFCLKSSLKWITDLYVSSGLSGSGRVMLYISPSWLYTVFLRGPPHFLSDHERCWCWLRTGNRSLDISTIGRSISSSLTLNGKTHKQKHL